MDISKSQPFMNFQSKRSHIAANEVYLFNKKIKFYVINLKEVRNNERNR